MKTALWLVIVIVLGSVGLALRRRARARRMGSVAICIGIAVLCGGIAYKSRSKIESVIKRSANADVAGTFVPLDIVDEPSVTCWPSFRGGPKQAHTRESDLQLLGQTPPTWKVEVEGEGHSSPCISGDSVFLTTCDRAIPQRSLLQFDIDSGEKVGELSLPIGKLEDLHVNNSYASTSPATDGHHVYTVSTEDETVYVTAADHRCNEIWSVAVGRYWSRHGIGSSPIVHRGLVICAIEGEDAPFIVGVNCKNGKIVWRNRLRSTGWSFGSPVVDRLFARDQLLLATCHAVASYDPMTGKQLWTSTWSPERAANCVVASDTHVFATSTSTQAEIICVRGDGVGAVDETHVEWRQTRGAAYVVSPLLISAGLLVLSDQGIMSLFSTETGKVMDRLRLRGNFFASPVAAGDAIVAANDDGELFIAQLAAGRLRLQSTLQLDGSIKATPSGCGGLLVRTSKSLYYWKTVDRLDEDTEQK